MRRRDVLGAAGSVVLGAGTARAQQSQAQQSLAQQNRPLRIAVTNDMSGPYAANAGTGSRTAIQLAIRDMNGRAGGRPVELVALDHQNKPDLASSLVTRAFDVDGVEAVFDIANSSLSLSIQEIARPRGKVVIHVGSSHDGLYGKQCSPTSALWLYDTYSLARGLTRTLVEAGGDTWFCIAVDYTFGVVMQQEAERTLAQLGGRMLGTVRHPLGATDFSSYLLSARASRAKVIMLANASADTINAIKQAHEFRMLGQGREARHPDLLRQQHQGARAGIGAGAAIPRRLLLGPR
ncbi:ABC transporter substrate-binding protein [Roseomonas acroporae]|uniref:ABC transporter substrate-binding protein n=1 Tax=Roseomonas acroporae TaxID=2937791 RepID=UPI0024A71345|nr:ABC transporter substrate-binding protein [Roseomonas acroporae]